MYGKCGDGGEGGFDGCKTIILGGGSPKGDVVEHNFKWARMGSETMSSSEEERRSLG